MKHDGAQEAFSSPTPQLQDGGSPRCHLLVSLGPATPGAAAGSGGPAPLVLVQTSFWLCGGVGSDGNQLTFCGTNLHRDQLPHLPAPLGVLIPTLPPPLPLPSQPGCHTPRPLRRGGCDPPAPSREAPPPPPPQPRPAPPRPARRSPAPPLGCGRPGGGRAARSGAARSRAAMMVGVRAARGRGGAGGQGEGAAGR